MDTGRRKAYFIESKIQLIEDVPQYCVPLRKTNSVNLHHTTSCKVHPTSRDIKACKKPLLKLMYLPVNTCIINNKCLYSPYCCLVAQSCLTLCDAMDCSPPGSSFHGTYFPGENTGVGFHSLLPGIFHTQGSNLGLLHCRQMLCHLSCQGSPGLK